MSVLNKLTSKGSNGNKKEWTRDQLKLAIGMKLLGCTRQDIAVATGHVNYDKDGKVNGHTVTYALTRKQAKFKSQEEFASFYGVSVSDGVDGSESSLKQEKEFTDFAQAELSRLAGDEPTEEVIEETVEDEINEDQSIDQLDEQAS